MYIVNFTFITDPNRYIFLPAGVRISVWRGGAATTRRRVATRKAGEIWVVVVERATTLGHAGNVRNSQ